jgi:hypothetical protein
LDLLEKCIYELEKELLKPETRRSSEKISEILAEDFIEFCSSGTIYRYNKNDIFEEANSLSKIEWKIEDFEIKLLAKDCILSTYKTIKHDKINSTIQYSLRSSIWKYINSTWKLTFHQGTLTTNI